MIEYYDAGIARYTSMKVGGTAKRICFPQNTDELKALVKELREASEKYVVLGNASNVIFPDGKYDGTVVFTKNCVNISAEGNIITAECGATVNALSLYANSLSLTGLEFIFGVPGTVGGAVYMNAGCYGGETKDCFVSAECLDKEGNVVTLYKNDMDFSYRHSILSANGFILLKAAFELKTGNREASRAVMQENMEKRKAKQPLDYPSCGSFFKRPEGNFAGSLIEQCGLKGVSVGGAAVSEKHAGFIINKGKATAGDICALAELVSETVRKKTGYKLEPEVIYLD